jgi:hypothetical protein
MFFFLLKRGLKNMNLIDAFKKTAVKKTNTLNIPISNIFVDSDTGKPIKFTFRPLLEEEVRKIRKQCEDEPDKFDSSIVCAMIVSPNILDDKQLQAEYDATDAPELLRVLLFEHEYNKLISQILDFRSKIDEKFEDKVKKQKN